MPIKFSDCEITAKPTGSLEVSVRVPIEVILGNAAELVEVYPSQDTTHSGALRKTGIPPGLDWEAVVTETILPLAQPPVDSSLMVSRVIDMEVEGQHLLLDCQLFDADFDH